MKNKIIKNIPNTLTISRIIASVLGAGFFVIGNIPIATGLYMYGAISDLFDGMAARKLNAFSELGRKLDALSDKLYAGSLLIPSFVCGNLLMLIPLLLELKISYINLKSDKLGFKAETLRIGKFKTAMLFPTMILGLLTTISLEFYPLFILLFPISTILQINSITSYNNLLNYNINKKEEEKTLIINNKEEKTLTISKENNIRIKSHNDSMNLVEELAFYVMTPYFNLEEDLINKNYKIKRLMK